MWAEEIGGLLFIAIDNSTCQVTAAQRQFFEEQAVHSSSPVVLLVHVPLASGALKAGMMVSDCGVVEGGTISNGFLCGDAAAKPSPPTSPDHRPDDETAAFLASAAACPKLAAVLAGHIHSAQAQVFSAVTGAPQLVADAGVTGGRRLIEFRVRCVGSKM